MGIKNKKANSRLKIKMRIRKSVNGTAERPRMSVYRSNKQIYVQLVDDQNGKTLASASSKEKGFDDKGNKIEQAGKLENLLPKKQKALELKAWYLIETVFCIMAG